MTEFQVRQALEIVLRDVAQAIVQALPQHIQQSPSGSQMSTEFGKQLLEGRLLITVGDAAAMLSISKPALYRLIMQGRIRTIQLGRSRRVPVSVLEEFVAREMQASR